MSNIFLKILSQKGLTFLGKYRRNFARNLKKLSSIFFSIFLEILGKILRKNLPKKFDSYSGKILIANQSLDLKIIPNRVVCGNQLLHCAHLLLLEMSLNT